MALATLREVLVVRVTVKRAVSALPLGFATEVEYQELGCILDTGLQVHTSRHAIAREAVDRPVPTPSEQKKKTRRVAAKPAKT